VGVVQSLSGTLSTSGTSVIDATLLAIEEINASGGLLGRPVKPIVADGRSDTETYAREAERLIAEEQVCTVFGCWTSATRKTVRPIFERYDHLLIYPVKYEGMETSPNIVCLGAAPNQQIIPAVVWASKSLGKKRFFLVGSDYVFPRAAGEIIKDQLGKMDATVVGELFVPLGSPEVEPIVQAILEANPDMILNTLAGDSNIAFFRTLRQAGIESADLPCLSFSVGEQELRGLDIKYVVDDYAAQTYFQSLDTDSNKAFVQRFKEKYPQRVVSDPMENAYVGVHLWAQAVREAQSIEPKKIRRAMLNQRLAAPEGDVRIDPDTPEAGRKYTAVRSAASSSRPPARRQMAVITSWRRPCSRDSMTTASSASRGFSSTSSSSTTMVSAPSTRAPGTARALSRARRRA
jgi:urea transport system substrate-binding protein